MFEWTTTDQKCFETVKELMSRNVLLNYYDENKLTVTEVDVSLKGVGAALLQEGKVIALSSKALSNIGQRYANIERERERERERDASSSYSVCMYVYGKPFTVETDHKPLEMIALKNLMAATPRLQRMLLRIQDMM